MGISSQKLNSALRDSKIEVMHFLNEIAIRYPNAISFAPGRPLDEYFEVEHSLQYIQSFVQHQAKRGISPVTGYATLGQYGRTNGIIGDLISRLLLNDEGIVVDGDDIVATVGCQEAMCLSLLALCGDVEDVALVADPAYIGISGAARILGIETIPVATDKDGIDLVALECTIAGLLEKGKRPKLLYLSPDFSNPTGNTMSALRRQELIDTTRRMKVIVLEDHAYNYFYYDGMRIPALKSAADTDHIIFLGSFSKSVFPGVRLGFVATTLLVDLDDGTKARLSDEMSKIKSLLTVNTSPLCQAIIGGLLLEENCTLKKYVVPRRIALQKNRDAMLQALASHFPSSEPWCKGVSWNCPSGGFFLSLTVPFEVSDADLSLSAKEYGVLWTPMSYFYLAKNVSNEIRLSFSYASPEKIEEGISSLARLIRSRVPK